MTVFAICMTALSGFLAGVLFSGISPKKTTHKTKVSPQKKNDIYLEKEYQNFLNYDGTTQI